MSVWVPGRPGSGNSVRRSFWIICHPLCWLIPVLALLVFLVTAPMATGQMSTDGPVVTIVNPAYGDQPVSDNLTTADGTHGLGYLPSPVRVSGPGAMTSPRMLYRMAASYSPTYDLRLLGRVTPVRDQGSSGSCWAFATYGSLESYLMPAESKDYSENNLKNLAGFDYDPNDGGDINMAMAYLLRWDGPVSEADDPFNPLSTTSPEGLTVQKHVQDVVILPSRTGPLDNDAIKAAVTDYGGVWAGMYWSTASYDPANASYYYDTSMGGIDGGHAVTIVGWNDSYDRNKFNIVPPGNGAFIAKNSWGTGWGESGYFYVSYYDSDFADTCAVFTAEPVDNYDTVHQYDPLGWTVTLNASGSDVGWFRNDFTVSSDENLVAVGFYVPQAYSTYDIYVYNGASLVSSATGITDPSMGYHTFPLDEPITFPAGSMMSIRVMADGPDAHYTHLCAEMPFGGYSSGAIANASEGYISLDGVSWGDVNTQFPGTSICLKAYTIDSADVPVGFGAASYAVDEAAGTVTITLEKTGSGYASVAYSTTDGNASAGVNYLAASGEVSFLTSETEQSFTIPVISDGVYAHPKVFYVNLSGLINANVTTESVPVYVGNSDSPPILYVEHVLRAVYDTTGVVTVNVTKAGSTEFDASVDYLTFNGTAEAGVDFTNTSGTLSFAPGEVTKSFDIALLPDTEYEADETIGVLLLNQAGAGLNSSATRNVSIVSSVPHNQTLHLVRGWNLISIQITPANDSITRVISPEAMADIKIVWHYNNSNPNAPVWQFYKPNRTVNTLFNMTDGKGYWFLANHSMDINITGVTPIESHVRLNKGWNMVGPEEMTNATPAGQYGSYYLTWGYQNGQWYYYKPSRTVNTLTEIGPGKGYWVLVK